ncbi:23S rRNA (cytosine(1962)-C(5))-methyltransferase RlmI, partial [Candidatus Fermentibacteria bacterium]|nr:23S rRNA (cytosine(1962)-C(5))-methyltransferase RlmI [Candidatus Fermentibacteria bacterium]
EEILQALAGASCAEGIWERSEGESRRLEGLRTASGLVSGREPPEFIEIEECGARFLVDVRAGHKTGFYLDQALNRRRTAAWMRGRRVLDCYGYTGGFTVHSLLSGAAFVETVDSSGPSLEIAKRNLSLNGLSCGAMTCSDAPSRLRAARSAGERFDAVILDPPRFVSRHEHVIRAGRAYKDINMVALSILPPGGILATFSCSGLVGVELFQKIVFEASVDAGRDVMVLERLGQPPDHPVLLSLPQGGYLKGLVCMAL